MISYQAIVSINGLLHLHSRLFSSIEQMKEEIEKNEAYTLMSWIEVKWEHK